MMKPRYLDVQFRKNIERILALMSLYQDGPDRDDRDDREFPCALVLGSDFAQALQS